jgi:hypothetical protein
MSYVFCKICNRSFGKKYNTTCPLLHLILDLFASSTYGTNLHIAKVKPMRPRFSTYGTNLHIAKVKPMRPRFYYTRPPVSFCPGSATEDTRAILLKTALVRVSCIQNTQIRGETIAKVFGKVNTFWTYQYAQAKTEQWEYKHLSCSSGDISNSVSRPQICRMQ